MKVRAILNPRAGVAAHRTREAVEQGQGLRGVAKKYLRSLLTNPLNLFRRLHLQSVTIIQPADILCNGAMSMCDGCPDITVWNNELVWSCRLEEQIKFGCFVRAVPKGETPTRSCEASCKPAPPEGQD